MKKSFTFIIIITIVMVMVSSCGNMFSTNSDVFEIQPSTAFVTSAEYLGDVNRFINGSFRSAQAVGEHQRESCLVEYNSVKQELLDYVEQFNCNSRMMGQYDNLEFSINKKYVEFTRVWSDMDQNYRNVIRIFVGNWKAMVQMGYLYAIGCEFNSDFTYDFSHSEVVDFGENLLNE